MKRYSLYLFDFDGTILDTSRGLNYVFKEAFKLFNIEIKDEQITELSRVPLSVSFPRLGGDMSRIQEFIDRLNEALDEEPSISVTRKYPETDEFFKYIKENNIKVGIVTSNITPHVKNVLVHQDIDPNIFSTYIGSDKCNKVKPDPKPVLMALEELDYLNRRDEVIYIGDSKNDCRCAINAKVDTLLLDRDSSQDNEFNKIQNLMELFK